VVRISPDLRNEVKGKADERKKYLVADTIDSPRPAAKAFNRFRVIVEKVRVTKTVLLHDEN
jgi:hypothetical protein